MRNSLFTTRSTKVCLAVAVASATAILASGSAEAAVNWGTVFRTSTVAYVNVRTSPSLNAPVVRRIPGGNRVGLSCFTYGSAVSGPYGVSNLWYRIDGGGYVTDALLNTGSNAPVTGQCSSRMSGRAWGRTQPQNAAAGYDQCTWFAYEQFREMTGVYPNLYGDAHYWDDAARQQGWTVVYDAQPRSIVVFERGIAGTSRYTGHVAWVNSVTQRPDGRYINITEKNYPRAGMMNNRTIKDVVGMSYILAP